MTNHPAKAILAFIILMTTFLTVLSPSVFAAQSGLAEADIPVRCIGGSHAAQVRLIADTPETPMPSGASGRIKDLTLSGGRGAFGKITYLRPDIYHYTVRKKGDETVYRVSVVATNDGNANMVVTKDGDTEKSELVFHEAANKSRQAEKAASPATGDIFPISLWLGISACAAAALFLLAAGASGPRRRKVLTRLLLIIMILTLGTNMAQTTSAKTLKVTLHRGGHCSSCGARIGGDKTGWSVIAYGGPGKTTYRWVSYTDPVTGKKGTSDAYCMEPPKGAPDYKRYNADYINPNKASGKWKNIAKILYFSDDGPGGSELRAYLKKNRKKFPDPQSAKQRFAMMHELVSYAFDSSRAFRTTEGKTLDTSYQKQVKALYRWCLNHTDTGVANPNFTISPGAATAVFDTAKNMFVSGTQSVTGSSTKQYFRYKVPGKTTMVVRHGGKNREYKAGTTASVHVGDSFYFKFDAARTTGIAKTTVVGEEVQVMPYKISVDGKQDMGFYVNDKSASARFSVSLKTADSGNIKIEKQTEDLAGETKPESDVTFRIWNTEYDTYEEALAVSNGARNLADEVTTDTDGAAISEKVAAGTYYVKQMTTKTGYRMMDPNPKTVTVTRNETTVVDNGIITDPEQGVRLRFSKLDGLTGELVTDSSAIFGVYSDEACENLICTITTATSGENAGTGTSVPMAPGTVYVKELTAPGGYVRSKEVKAVKLSYSAENKVEDEESGEISYIREEEIVNWRPQFHDVVLNKRVGQGETSQDFAFDIRISNFEASDSVTITRSLSGGAEENVPFTIADGKTTVTNIRIRAGGQIVLHHLPVGAKYTITERGTEGYKPSFKATPKESVKVASNMGVKGEPLSVTNEVCMETEEEMQDVRIVYDWKNTQEITHTLLVEKQAVGIGKDDSDVFEFTAEFTNIRGMIPGYIIYARNSEGELTEAESEAPEESTAINAELKVALSSGEKVRFFNIMPGAKYRIREEASDYIASYRVTEEAGTIPVSEKANTASDTALETAENTMPGPAADEEAAFLFENYADEEPDGNTLYVEKRLNAEDTGQAFDFTADLNGLKAGDYYCFLREGDSVYTLTAALSGVTVKDQNYATVAGVPIKVTRADGKSRYLRTGADGTAVFSQNWLARGGNGDITISWIGDDVSLTRDDEGEETETETSSVEGYDLTTFQAHADGKATAAFALKAQEELFFPMLPAGASYTVTEAANNYEPSYEIYRRTGDDMKKRDAQNGGTRAELTTEEQQIPSGIDVADTVSFINTADTRSLKITKTVSDGAAGEFPFTAEFSGLSREKYIAVTEGAASANLSIGQNGAITVTITGAPAFGSDFSGIPIRFVRGDRAARTVYTDSGGKVTAGAYIDWLTGYDDSHDFQIEFLGQVYDRTW